MTALWAAVAVVTLATPPAVVSAWLLSWWPR